MSVRTLQTEALPRPAIVPAGPFSSSPKLRFDDRTGFECARALLRDLAPENCRDYGHRIQFACIDFKRVGTEHAETRLFAALDRTDTIVELEDICRTHRDAVKSLRDGELL